MARVTSYGFGSVLLPTLPAHPRPTTRPPPLQTRIRDYHSFSLSRQTMFDEAECLGSLPNHLRREVALYLHRDMISLTPFFKEAPTSFVATLVQVS